MEFDSHSILKRCNHCDTEKPLFDFYKEKRGIRGVRAQCRACISERKKKSYDPVANALRSKVWRKNNKQKAYEITRAWKKANKDRVAASEKKYRDKNAERINARVSAWQKANPEMNVARSRRYQKAHPEKIVAAVQKRRAIKLNATPAWDRELTDFVTLEAADLARLRNKVFGFQWEVDHIVPLAGKNVCGLHTWTNLRVIPALVNRRKGNKHEDRHEHYHASQHKGLAAHQHRG
jgi:hypothetical protein